MFLLTNESRANASDQPELLLSSDKVSIVNSMRDLSAEIFRQHLLEKYSLPPKARARVEHPANSTLARPLRELWEATDLSVAEFAERTGSQSTPGRFFRHRRWSRRCVVRTTVVRRRMPRPLPERLAEACRIGETDSLCHLINQQVRVLQKFGCDRPAHIVEHRLIR
jgi:hypothetical protein